MTLQAALVRLHDWAAEVTESSAEREEELIAQQNRQAMKWIEGQIGRRTSLSA